MGAAAPYAVPMGMMALMPLLGGMGGGGGATAQAPNIPTGGGMSGQPIQQAPNLPSQGPAFTPMSQLSPAQQGGVNQALAANPSTAGLVGQVAAVDPMTPDPSSGGMMGGLGAGMNAAAPNIAGVGSMYLDYLMQRNLLAQQQRTRYADPHATPMSAMPQLSLMPAETFAMPQI